MRVGARVHLKKEEFFSSARAREARAGTFLAMYIRTFFNFEQNLTIFRSKKKL